MKTLLNTSLVTLFVLTTMLVQSVQAQTTGVIDITGTYVSEITSHKADFDAKKHGKMVLLLEQHGNTVTGTDSSGKADLRGTRIGDTIKFDFWAPYWSYGADGVWKVNADGTQLEGSWENKDKGFGEWNLTKIESDAAQNPKVESTSATDYSDINVTGTYSADIISTHSMTLKTMLSDPEAEQKPEVKIVQNGSQITGTYDDGEGQIWGEIQGDTIKFDYTTHNAHTGRGVWKVKPGDDEITGTFTPMSHSDHKRGEWNLTKIE